MRVFVCSILLLGASGSETERRAQQLSDLYAVPLLNLPEAFAKAFKARLLLELRQEKRANLEEALQRRQFFDDADLAEEAEKDDPLWQLLSASESEGSAIDSHGDLVKQCWMNLQEQVKQTVYRDAMRTVLHPLMGPAFVQGQTAPRT